MSVAQEIQRIAQAKADIRNAILSKGVDVADTDRIDTFAQKIATIEGGSGEGFGKYRVRFFDYDGTILKTVYTDGGAVEAPAVPDHERLLFQEWNNDFDNITDDLDVGAIYTTKSGKCEFVIDINSLTGLTQYVGVGIKSGTVTVDWGDGAVETLSTVGDARIAHTYSVGGKYTIMVSGTLDWTFADHALTKNSSGTAFDNTSVVAVRIVNLKSSPGQSFNRLVTCRTLSCDKASTANTQRMYAGMPDLRHFNIPRKVNAQMWMFANCYRLNRVVFPDSFTGIPPNFCENSSLRCDFVLPPNLTEISWGAFPANGNYDGFSEITIPSKVSSIGRYAFNAVNGCSCLRKVVMKPTTPPSIQVVSGDEVQSSFPVRGQLKEIIVPAGCAEAYKNATNWSYYADIIKEEDI